MTGRAAAVLAVLLSLAVGGCESKTSKALRIPPPDERLSWWTKDCEKDRLQPGTEAFNECITEQDRAYLEVMAELRADSRRNSANNQSMCFVVGYGLMCALLEEFVIKPALEE